MADNDGSNRRDDGNQSDHEQFVSAEGSENSSIAGEEAVQPAEQALQEDIAIEEEAAAEEADSIVSGEDLAFNVVDADEALLLNEQNHDQNDDEELGSGDSSDEDADLDDDIEEDDEEVMEEEGEEAQEENPLGSQSGNKVSPGPGCSHYRRGCALIAPCCDKQYPCRHCHNENEQHEINRFSISEVVCLTCEKRQPITDRCIECAALFGNYVCLKCRVWDMDFKGQWHCDGCGICRLGGKDHFFHCDRCGYCLSVALRGDHRCIERATRTGCAICLSDLHDTRTPLVVPACGHPVHRSCWRQMIDSRRYFCPTCRRAVVDLTDIWADLDNRIGDQLNRLPAEFSLPIFCHDCQQHNSVRYNIIGYFKCPGCGSYNTQR